MGPAMFVPVVYAMFVLATAVFLLLCEWPQQWHAHCYHLALLIWRLLTMTAPIS